MTICIVDYTNGQNESAKILPKRHLAPVEISDRGSYAFVSGTHNNWSQAVRKDVCTIAETGSALFPDVDCIVQSTANNSSQRELVCF